MLVWGRCRAGLTVPEAEKLVTSSNAGSRASRVPQQMVAFGPCQFAEQSAMPGLTGGLLSLPRAFV